MGLLAPSVLSFDINDLARAVPIMEAAGAGCIHFDVMDGQFVPPITFGAHFVSCLRPLTAALFEVHLMTESPEAHFEAFVEAGAQRIIFHAEATAHSHRLVQRLRELGVQTGIAINPGTPIEAVKPLVDLVDEVLVMSVNPGWGGQPFIEAVLAKVEALRAMRSDLLIEVDGGVDPRTLPLAKSAGADVFVVGSYLVRQPNLAAAIRDLVALCA